jgi:hypothetical protein
MRVTIAVALFLAAAAALPAADPQPELGLLVPAYFYPSKAGMKEWDRLLDAAGKAPVVVIVNPASGPGAKVDDNYKEVFERAKKSKATLIGYVSTRYAKRPLADVKADVDRWVKQYPGVQGVFFDEQVSAADGADYCEKLYEYARKEKRLAMVVTNPGTQCAEDYLKRPAADAACLFENYKGFDTFKLPTWAAGYAPGRFAVLSYEVEGAEAMGKQVRAAAEKKAGLVYVTNAKRRNPWDRLPEYWDAEVALVRELNQKKPR